MPMMLDMEKMLENAADAEQFLKLMANKNRLMILCTLNQGELSVTELNQIIPLAQSALSQHLASLRKSKLVETRREAQTIYYRIVDQRVSAMLNALYDMFCQSE
jgi:DNA-binding transcriptional ArsR family regulator